MLQRLSLAFGFISLLGIIVLSVYTITSSPKLVYVDSNKLLNNYKGMQDARAAYEKKSLGWKSNIDTLASEVQHLINRFEKESDSMSAKERELSKELIHNKQNQLVQYQQALNAQAQQEDAKMTSDVINQVNAYLKKYGKEKGYKIIMGATEYGNIAYADEGLDITDKVLTGLNNEYLGK